MKSVNFTAKVEIPLLPLLHLVSIIIKELNGIYHNGIQLFSNFITWCVLTLVSLHLFNFGIDLWPLYIWSCFWWLCTCLYLVSVLNCEWSGSVLKCILVVPSCALFVKILVSFKYTNYIFHGVTYQCINSIGVQNMSCIDLTLKAQYISYGISWSILICNNTQFITHSFIIQNTILDFSDFRHISDYTPLHLHDSK